MRLYQQIASFIVLFFPVLNAYGQLSWKEWQLSAKVKAMYETELQPEELQNPPAFGKQIRFFDKKGRLSQVYELDYRGAVKNELIYTYDGQNRHISTQGLQSTGFNSATDHHAQHLYDQAGKRSETRFYYPNGEFWYKQSLVYNPQQQLAKQISLNAENREIERWEYEYDSLGNLITKKHFYQQKELNKQFLEYKDGRLLSEIYYYSYDGSLSQKEVFSYGLDSISELLVLDAQGQEAGKDSFFYNQQAQLVEKRCYVSSYGADNSLQMMFAKKEKFGYDLQGRQIERVIYDQNQTESHVYHQDYDSTGRLMARRVLDTLGNELLVCGYEYDKNGRLIGEKQRTGKNNSSLELKEYNKDGKLTRYFFGTVYFGNSYEKLYYYDPAGNLVSSEHFKFPSSQNISDNQAGKNRLLVATEKSQYQNKLLIETVEEQLDPNSKSLQLRKKIYSYPTEPQKGTFLTIINENGDTIQTLRSYQLKKNRVEEPCTYKEGQPECKKLSYSQTKTEQKVEVEQNGSKFVSVKKTFDKKGNLLSAISYNPKGEIRSQNEYLLQFDPKGNWNKQETKRNGQTEKISLRRFVYY